MERMEGVAAAGAGGLAVASALHAAWALGAAWPAPDRQTLAAVVAGTAEVPGAGACWLVAGALAAAAAVTAGVGGTHPIAIVARAGVTTALLTRAATGLTGQTHRLVSWTPSPRFAALDRRWYGPACGVLGVLAAAGLRVRREDS
jgi:hypothetical protein